METRSGSPAAPSRSPTVETSLSAVRAIMTGPSCPPHRYMSSGAVPSMAMTSSSAGSAGQNLRRPEIARGCPRCRDASCAAELGLLASLASRMTVRPRAVHCSPRRRAGVHRTPVAGEIFDRTVHPVRMLVRSAATCSTWASCATTQALEPPAAGLAQCDASSPAAACRWAKRFSSAADARLGEVLFWKMP